jgi:acyl carrier protein
MEQETLPQQSDAGGYGGSPPGATAAGLRQRVFEAITVVLPRVLDRDALEITPEMKLMSDLGMRSASMLELLLELEDNLDIQIDVEDITEAAMISVGDLADFVASHASTND